MKAIIILVICIASIVGYVSNIIKLCECDFKPSYKAETIHIIGVAIPVIGMVTGYIEIGK